jgi:hypothetical protein
VNELASRVRAAGKALYRHLDVLFVLVVVVVGIAARFYRLGVDSLWLDEAITYERSSLPLDKLLHNAIERLHLPGYFVIMHYWLRLGDDEFMLRAPAAAFGCLGVIAAIVLGWLLAGRRGAWVLGLLVALSPPLLRYSQEARMYSQFVLMTTIALCGLLWLVKNRDAAALWPFARRAADAQPRQEPDDGTRRRARRAWIVFIIGLIGTIYSHNTGMFFWAASWLAAGLVWLALPGKRWPFLRNWLLANAAVFLAWTPWLGPLSRQTKRISQAFWVKFPTPQGIVATLTDLFLFDDKHLLPGAAIALGALLGLWALRRNKTLAGALLLFALAPPAMILLVSLERPIWIPRIMLWCSVPFFALVACGIASLRGTLPALVGLSLAAMIAVTGAAGLRDGYFARLHKPRWEEALRHIQANERPGESIVLLIGQREGRLVRYYTRRQTNPIPKFQTRHTMVDKLERNLRGYRRAWLLAASSKPNIRKVLARMPKYGKLVDRRRYGARLQVWEWKLKPWPPPPEAPPPEPPPPPPPQSAPPPRELPFAPPVPQAR